MSKIYEIGLGAGMAKAAKDIDPNALDTVSIVEVGSLTLNESKGNPEPTSHWDEENQAGYNSIGLKNMGIAALFAVEAPKIARLFVAKHATLDLSLAPKEPGDLAKMMTVVRTNHSVLPIRYLIVNGACPNKWKNGEQQAITSHDPAATRVLLEEARGCPFDLGYKIAPDTPLPVQEQLVDICYELGVKILVSGNTRGVDTPIGPNGKPVISQPRCGQSGAPLFAGSVSQVASLRRIIDDKGDGMRLSGMGGVLNAEHAHSMFDAGADDVRVASLFYFCGGWKAVTKLAAAVHLS